MYKELSLTKERENLNSCGFGLIELLVVMAIMAIISAYTFANYRSFGEDEYLKNKVLDIQSMLRLAQSSATANAICNTNTEEYGAIWRVAFSIDAQKSINLRCQRIPCPIGQTCPITLKKTIVPGADLRIQTIRPTDPAVSPDKCPQALPLQIHFAPLTGKLSFFPDGAYPQCQSLTMTYINNNTSNAKSLIIETGGNIYVE